MYKEIYSIETLSKLYAVLDKRVKELELKSDIKDQKISILNQKISDLLQEINVLKFSKPATTTVPTRQKKASKLNKTQSTTCNYSDGDIKSGIEGILRSKNPKATEPRRKILRNLLGFKELSEKQKDLALSIIKDIVE